MSWSKLHKNCIIAGPLEALCLVCEIPIKTQSELDTHVEVDVHLKALNAAPYIEKYKPHNIRKVTLGYYCEFCNLVLCTPAKVNLHITIPEHEQNRGFLLIKRVNDSVIVFDDIYINHRSWNGFVEDTCAICNVEYYDELKHLNLHSHIFNLITKKIEFLGDNMVYRNIDESSYQCMVCNLVLASSTLSTHIEQPGHIKMVEKCREAGRAILNLKSGTDHATTNTGKDAARATSIGNDPGRATTSIGNDAGRATTSIGNDAGRAFLNILNPPEKKKADEKKKTDSKTKKNESKKSTNNTYVENEAFICGVLGAKNYIVSQDDGKSMCLLCDWSMETSAAAAHVAGRHHITILKMHKERLDRMSKDENSEPDSGNAGGSSATGNQKVKPEPKDQLDSGKASAGKAAGDEKGKIKEASPKLHKNGLNTNKSETKDKPEIGKTSDEKSAEEKGKMRDSSPKLHDNGGNINKPEPKDKLDSGNASGGKATADEKDIGGFFKDSSPKPHNNGQNVNKSEPKDICRRLPESENACGGSKTGDEKDNIKENIGINIDKSNSEDEPDTQNASAVTATSNDRDVIIDLYEEFQAYGISVNFVTNIATCKKCSKTMDLKFTAIRQHIKEHYDALPRPLCRKAPEVEDDIQSFLDLNRIIMIEGGERHCELCRVNLPISLKSVKQHVNGTRHLNNLAIRSGNNPAELVPQFHKVKLRDYVTSMMGLEDSIRKDVILNEKFDITMMSYLLMSSVSLRCYICDEDLERGQIDAHKVSTEHITRVADSKVLVSLENEFVRELRRNSYHCGICSWVSINWTGMMEHLKSRTHLDQKYNMKWRLAQHLTQVARVQWERSPNLGDFMGVADRHRNTRHRFEDYFTNW
ncbi:uncharacterized protein LOC114351236 isoform X2 [Ostrinia furnacalis]|uniref:uncharacterized protein LOC114351236 isoform X2 n=1 Tax=Ostrinia furnacalis TaxID=93504 RepID=UPI00103CBBA0|nr:uncharacterized protein LOC114351236 isoform X2 [Ostrinia furnacalis]